MCGAPVPRGQAARELEHGAGRRERLELYVMMNIDQTETEEIQMSAEEEQAEIEKLRQRAIDEPGWWRVPLSEDEAVEARLVPGPIRGAEITETWLDEASAWTPETERFARELALADRARMDATVLDELTAGLAGLSEEQAAEMDWWLETVIDLAGRGWRPVSMAWDNAAGRRVRVSAEPLEDEPGILIEESYTGVEADGEARPPDPRAYALPSRGGTAEVRRLMAEGGRPLLARAFDEAGGFRSCPSCLGAGRLKDPYRVCGACSGGGYLPVATRG